MSGEINPTVDDPSKRFRKEQADIETRIRANPGKNIAKWVNDRWVLYSDAELAEMDAQAQIHTSFIDDQAAIVREVKANLDKPVAEFSNGVWRRLNAQEKEKWYAAQEEHRVAAPAKELALLKHFVDNTANEVRTMFVTPTEIAIYVVKHSEALRYTQATDPPLGDYPMIAGESQRSGKTPLEVATMWLTNASKWHAIASSIDSARMDAKEALEAANDSTTREAVVAAYKGRLAALIALEGK